MCSLSDLINGLRVRQVGSARWILATGVSLLLLPIYKDHRGELIDTVDRVEVVFDGASCPSLHDQLSIDRKLIRYLGVYESTIKEG